MELDDVRPRSGHGGDASGYGTPGSGGRRDPRGSRGAQGSQGPQGSRTLRRVAVSVVLGVLCLAGALVAIRDVARGAVTPHPSPAGPTSPSPLPGRVPIVRLIQPARLFWPGGVHTLPATLPNGSAYQVIAVLPDDRYLVTTGDSDPSDGETAVRVFDAGTRTVATITALPADAPAQLQLGLPRNTLLYPPVVDGDVVAWADTVVQGNLPYTDVWAASVTSGHPVLLSRIAGASKGRSNQGGQSKQVGQPRPVGGTVVWDRYGPPPAGGPSGGQPPGGQPPGGQSSGGRSSGTGSYDVPAAGIYRAPATGGDAALVPGTAGYDLVTGAWAQPDGARVASGGDVLFDVLTGQRTRVPAGGVEHDERLECSPAWCAGAGVENISFAVVKADGSGGPTELDRPYRLADGGAVALGAGSDKHGNPQGVVVWNPTTGVWAGLDGRYQVPDGPFDADVRVLQARSAPGAPVEVFDLSVAGRPA